jgi:hypothetical protein
MLNKPSLAILSQKLYNIWDKEMRV